jgi:hypothetical protein
MSVLKKISARLLIFCLLPINVYANDYAGQEIRQFQSKVDVALENSNSNMLSDYFTDDFFFGIAGCKGSQFKAYILTKNDFIESLVNLEGNASEVISKQRIDSVIEISQNGQNAVQKSFLLERSMVSGREKVTKSDEKINYVIDEKVIKISSIQIEINEQYYIESGDEGKSYKSIICSRNTKIQR